MAELASLIGLLVALALGVAFVLLRRHYANQPKRPLTLAEELERNRALNAKHKPKPRHEATGANNW